MIRGLPNAWGVSFLSIFAKNLQAATPKKAASSGAA
jgi:hypothetical protein